MQTIKYINWFIVKDVGKVYMVNAKENNLPQTYDGFSRIRGKEFIVDGKVMTLAGFETMGKTVVGDNGRVAILFKPKKLK